jgi:hypothetical protein
LESDDSVEWLSQNVNPDWIPSQNARTIFVQRKNLHESKSWKGIHEFIAAFDDLVVRSFITECLTRPLVSNVDGSKITRKVELPNPKTQLINVVTKFRNQFLDRQLAASIQRASQPETPEADRMELLRQQQELRQQKRAPLK